jgi:phospholipid-translocating ATPase
VNTSGVTKLTSWRNVNQPRDPRNAFERLLGLNKPGRVTKGVRKLREREAGVGMAGVVGSGVKSAAPGSARGQGVERYHDGEGDYSYNNESTASFSGGGGGRLDDIQSVDERSFDNNNNNHVYPPGASTTSLSNVSSTTRIASGPNPSFGSLSKYAPSLPPQHPSGALDFSKPTTSSAHWERTLWKKLEVGDIVLLRENDQVPADIVVLSTSDPDGLCYLETKNLDGETNLKPRRALKPTWAIRGEEDVERCAFVLDSEPPHANLYLYHGVLRYRDASAGGEKKTSPVTINELLLRGCSLRNTQWVIGLVVFTGSDTKIMLNGGDTPSKRSKIEKETNFNVIVNFVVLSLMCVVAAIFYGWVYSLTQFFFSGVIYFIFV